MRFYNMMTMIIMVAPVNKFILNWTSNLRTHLLSMFILKIFSLHTYPSKKSRARSRCFDFWCIMNSYDLIWPKVSKKYLSRNLIEELCSLKKVHFGTDTPIHPPSQVPFRTNLLTVSTLIIFNFLKNFWL